MASQSIEHVKPIVIAVGRILKPYVGTEKPGKMELLWLAGRSFGVVSEAAQGIKQAPGELWDLDTDEAQELSAALAGELAGAAEQTQVDNIASAFFYAIPQIKAAVVGIQTGDTWELKGILTGAALGGIGRVVDAIWPPKADVLPETES